MDIDTKAFREYLACYGSHVEMWPPHARPLGLRALERPEYAALIEKERLFENLLSEDRVDAAPAGLLSGLLHASLAKPPAPKMSEEQFPVRSYFNRAAFAVMLVMGFVIGFNTLSTSSEEALLQSYSDDEEITL